jgi:long-subunit fatty acid transport protein
LPIVIGERLIWTVVKNLQIERADGSVLSDHPEQWRCTWFGSIGATWRPNSDWTLRSRAGL